MRLPDALIPLYFEIYTEMPETELKEVSQTVNSDPFGAKKQLARLIVQRYHGENVAQEESNWFESVFSQRQAPSDIPEFLVEPGTLTLFDVVRLFLGANKSGNEVRRLFQQGAVMLDNRKVTNPSEPFTPTTGNVFHVGKRTWFRVKVVSKDK